MNKAMIINMPNKLSDAIPRDGLDLHTRFCRNRFLQLAAGGEFGLVIAWEKNLNTHTVRRKR